MKEIDFKPFDDVDFSAFEEHKRRDPFYNEARLRVKRKLAALGKILEKKLSPSMKLKHRTSLSHPYTFNNYYVASQWVYFSRSDKDRNALKGLLGADFGDELDPTYIHVMLMVEIHLERLIVALRIHQLAWWDGQNLKKKCLEAKNLEAFAHLLNQLPPGFSLTIHDWKKEYPCQSIKTWDLENYFKYYIPGDHWLHLTHNLHRQDPLATSPQSLDWMEKGILALAPIHSFIAWSPENNYLFGK